MVNAQGEERIDSLKNITTQKQLFAYLGEPADIYKEINFYRLCKKKYRHCYFHHQPDDYYSLRFRLSKKRTYFYTEREVDITVQMKRCKIERYWFEWLDGTKDNFFTDDFFKKGRGRRFGKRLHRNSSDIAEEHKS